MDGCDRFASVANADMPVRLTLTILAHLLRHC